MLLKYRFVSAWLSLQWSYWTKMNLQQFGALQWCEPSFICQFSASLVTNGRIILILNWKWWVIPFLTLLFPLYGCIEYIFYKHNYIHFWSVPVYLFTLLGNKNIINCLAQLSIEYFHGCFYKALYSYYHCNYNTNVFIN